MDFKQRDIEQFFKKPDPHIRCVVLFGTHEGMIADLLQEHINAVGKNNSENKK